MAGVSGIRGSGGGTGAGSDFSGGRENAARFKQGRSLGDVVCGIFLRPESGNLGWVDIDGITLLARLPLPENARAEDFPPPGTELYFIIEALEPEIMLHLASSAGSAASAGAAKRASFTLSDFGGLPLARQASLYATARDSLDSLLRQQLWPTLQPEGIRPEGPDTASLRKAFISFVGNHARALELYARVRLWSEALVSACRTAGLVYFRHLPWLAPTARAVECALLARDGGREILAGLRPASGAAVMVSGILKEDCFVYTLLLPQSSPTNSPEPERFPDRFASSLAAALPETGLSDCKLRCLAIRQTSSGTPDLLGSLLARCSVSGHHAARRHFTKRI